MEEVIKHALVHRYFLIAIITSLMGAYTRISYEKERNQLKKHQVIVYITTSIFVAYIIYEALKYWGGIKATGFACAIGGLISVDIIKLLIEELPKMIKKRMSKHIEGDSKKNKQDELL